MNNSEWEKVLRKKEIESEIKRSLYTMLLERIMQENYNDLDETKQLEVCVLIRHGKKLPNKFIG